jgi:hypothetical protein
MAPKEICSISFKGEDYIYLKYYSVVQKHNLNTTLHVGNTNIKITPFIFMCFETIEHGEMFPFLTVI